MYIKSLVSVRLVLLDVVYCSMVAQNGSMYGGYGGYSPHRNFSSYLIVFTFILDSERSDFFW